jgi:hypothetical protein
MQYLTKIGLPLLGFGELKPERRASLRHIPIHVEVAQALMQVAQAIQSAQAYMQVGPGRTAMIGQILHPLVVKRGGT